MNELSSIELIKTILAPAVMISACGLIFLALINRYLTITLRIRSLNEERRKILHTESSSAITDLEYMDVVRLRSIELQLKDFISRGSMLKNSLTLIIVSVIFDIVASLSIAVNLFAPSYFSQMLPMIVFLVGMGFLLVGIVIAAVEIRRSFKNIIIEVKAEE
ncbi:MAG: DUF2721 domain-containing protein [Chloroflexota bacterium]